MAIKKNEKKLLIIFGLMVYILVLIKFVLLPAIPKIKQGNQRLEDIKAQKAALEADYRNLENYKIELESNITIDERLGEYLMNNAGLSDSIEFIEKLALMMGTEISNISLGQPSEISADGVKYYGFPVKFSANMTYSELKELMKYCEGGSKKVRVDSFNIKPDSSVNEETTQDSQTFDSSLSLVFYSMDKNAADKLFQFSRSMLQGFERNDGTPIFVKEDATLPEVDLPDKISYSEDKKPSGSVITSDNADFIFFHRGYLYGGYNFETYAKFNSTERIQETIAGTIDVLLTLDNKTYTIESVDYTGRTNRVTGDIPDKNFTMHIESDINTNVKENENLQLNIKIQNNSDKTIRIKMEQTGNRVKLMDRDGNDITGKNEKEKVYL